MLAGAVATAADELVRSVAEIATGQSAVDELHRALRTLSGAPWELARNRPQRLERLAAFLPSNNVLYAYVLFAVVPALYSEQVLIRPSRRVAAATARIHELFCSLTAGVGGLGRITMMETTQREFVRASAAADAVVFTGRYENSLDIARALPSRCRFLTFGSGPNAFVIGAHADLEHAVDDLVLARLYNSGQDCLCPDLVLVDKAARDDLVRRLLRRVSDLAVRDPRDRDALVVPLAYDDAVAGAEELLARHADAVLAGGVVRRRERIVEPTVLELPFSDRLHPPELFSPIFCLTAYDHADDVRAWLESPTERERGMYVSVYGEPGLGGAVIGTSVVCHERTTFDVEDGNRPFGGFGERAGNVRRHDEVVARPLLLSAEVGERLCPPVADDGGAPRDNRLLVGGGIR